jgi:hypothetical protein
MVPCESCGHVYDEWMFTNGSKYCDYCYAMGGFGYRMKPASTYLDKYAKRGILEC